MDSLELAKANILSPMVLCFLLGACARGLKSDLRLPEAVYTALSTYLLLAIGLKGGAALSKSGIGPILAPIGVTLALGVIIPVAVFAITQRLGRLKVVDAAALAAHYGSVSAVTFIASLSFLDSIGVAYDGYLPALVAILEIPAIIVALLLARGHVGKGRPLVEVIHEILAGKSIVLLAGGMLIGYACGPGGFARVEAFFVAPFQGVLCLFLLDMGLLAASRLREVRKTGYFLVGFAIVAPLFHGTLGVWAASVIGMGVGSATVLGVLAASASYIAAPAAVRLALPEANPAIYLTSSIGITFPFNLAVGIPLYHALAKLLES